MRRSIATQPFLPLSALLLAPLAAQGAMPPGGGGTGSRPPITRSEVETLQLSMIQALMSARKAGRPMDRALRAHNDVARRAASRLVGRSPASPEVGPRLFDVYLAAGRRNLAAQSMLVYLEAEPAGLVAPQWKTKKGEPESIAKARPIAANLNRALAQAREPRTIERLVAVGLRIFPNGDAVYSTESLWWLLSRRCLEGVKPDAIHSQARLWSPLLREDRRADFLAAAALLGRPAPAIATDHVLGAKRPPVLGDLRGKVVLLDFFTPSSPLGKTSEELRRFATHRPDEVRVIGVTHLRGSFQDPALNIWDSHTRRGKILAADKELRHLARWRKHHRLHWPFVVEGKMILYRPKGGARKSIGKGLFPDYERIEEGVNFAKYGARYEHHVVVVDRLGIVRAVHVRHAPVADLRKTVERLLTP